MQDEFTWVLSAIKYCAHKLSNLGLVVLKGLYGITYDDLKSQLSIDELKHQLCQWFAKIQQAEFWKEEAGAQLLDLWQRVMWTSFQIMLSTLRFFRWLIAPDLILRVFFRHAIALLLLVVIPRLLRRVIGPRITVAYEWIWTRALHIWEGTDIVEYRAKLKRKMEKAENYHTWTQYARKLDIVEGRHVWKKHPESTYYDYKRIQENTKELRQLIESEDARSIMYFLRSRLLRNLGGIGDERLYSKLRVGTKQAIEEYIAEASCALKLLSEIETPEISTAEKLAFFSETRHAFGRSALLFSGGATLGLYHAGLGKALLEENLLPRVISGSSVGSIIASFVCTKTDDELWDCLTEKGQIDFDFFPRASGFIRRLKRFWNDGILMDINKVRDCVHKNIGDITFQEAYERTGRILNITVSPDGGDGTVMPRLLNYLTAPNVLIYSAATASCAIPYVYRPVELLVKSDTGEIKPYYLKGIKFSDGSVCNDLPMERLSELFNVNHFIVSQVNPHISLLVEPLGLLGSLGQAAFHFLIRMTSSTLLSLLEFQCCRDVFGGIRGVLVQRYTGDITFTPAIPFHELWSILSNPSQEKWDKCVKYSQQQAWPQISLVRAHCAVEFTLDECLRRMRGLLIQESSDQGPDPVLGSASAPSSAQNKSPEIHDPLAFPSSGDSSRSLSLSPSQPPESSSQLNIPTDKKYSTGLGQRVQSWSVFPEDQDFPPGTGTGLVTRDIPGQDEGGETDQISEDDEKQATHDTIELPKTFSKNASDSEDSLERSDVISPLPKPLTKTCHSKRRKYGTFPSPVIVLDRKNLAQSELTFLQKRNGRPRPRYHSFDGPNHNFRGMKKSKSTPAFPIAHIPERMSEAELGLPSKMSYTEICSDLDTLA